MNGINQYFYVFWYIAHYLIFFNCSLDPFIYGVTNDNFRRAFKQSFWYTLFCCQYCNCKNNSNVGTDNFRNRSKICLEPREPALAVIPQERVRQQLRNSDGGWMVVDKSPNMNGEKTTAVSKTTKLSVIPQGIMAEISSEKKSNSISFSSKKTYKF